MKESHRLRIERHLAEFAAWRASGLTLQAFVQQRGEELTVWRARLTWERRWQQMLAGTYQKPVAQKRTTAFVKAIAQQGQAPIPNELTHSFGWPDNDRCRDGIRQTGCLASLAGFWSIRKRFLN